MDNFTYKGHLGGRADGPFGVIQERFLLADFTDGGAADGTVEFANALPEGAAIWSIGIQVDEGFTGTAAVTGAIDVDGVAQGAGGLVLTAAGDEPVGQGVDGSALDIRLSSEAGLITLTVSDTVDFGVIVTGATGDITVRIWYVQMAPVASR